MIGKTLDMAGREPTAPASVDMQRHPQQVPPGYSKLNAPLALFFHSVEKLGEPSGEWERPAGNLRVQDGGVHREASKEEQVPSARGCTATSADLRSGSVPASREPRWTGIRARIRVPNVPDPRSKSSTGKCCSGRIPDDSLNLQGPLSWLQTRNLRSTRTGMPAG